MSDDAFLFVIAPAETNAGLVSADLKFGWPVGHIRRYGGVPDGDGSAGGADNIVAFKNLARYLQSAGGGAGFFEGGRYRIAAGGLTGAVPTPPIFRLNGCENVALHFNGAEIVLDGTYDGSQFLEVFSFDNCKWVRGIGPVTFRCTVKQPKYEAAARGPECVKLWNKCDDVEFEHITAINCRGAVIGRRNSLEDPKGSSWRFRIRAIDTGYGLANTRNGDEVEADIETVRAVRSYYPYGVKHHRIAVWSTDHTGNADVNISSAVGEGCEDLFVTYRNDRSTVADASITCCKVSFTDEHAATHKDIRLILNISAPSASSYFGWAVIVEKLNNANTDDSVDRGHKLDGLTIEGQILAKNSNQRLLAICALGTWGAGEYVHNVKLQALRMIGGSNAIVNLASLKDDNTLLSDVRTTTTLDLRGNTSGPPKLISCVGCEAQNFTASTSDPSLVEYQDCRIANGSTQSITNKTFTGTTIAGLSRSLIPPALAVSHNDYSPAGGDLSEFWTLDSTTNVNITGMKAPRSSVTAVRRTIVNRGNFTITLVQNSSSSSSGQRFILSSGANLALTADRSATFVWTAGAWRQIAGS